MESPTLRSDAATAGTERTESIVAPGLTRVLAGLLMLGVMVQAVLAGAFLAGRPHLRSVHAGIGHTVGLLGILVLIVGVVGRFRTREPFSRLATRAAIFLATAFTIGSGEIASHGTRDLLMLHIPLAIAVVGMAESLRRAGRKSARD